MFLTEKGTPKGQFVVIKPSQAQFTEIPGLNRNREKWDLAKVEDLGLSIRQRGIVTPLVGYAENKKIKIVRGAQRLKIAQQLEAEGYQLEGKPVLLPVTLIAKPESDEDIQTILLDAVADHAHRYEDDYSTRVESFKTLRDLGMSLEEIGKQTGYSHTLVDQHLKVSSVKLLSEAAQKGHPVKQLAAFTTKAYQTKDEKTGKLSFDQKKIKEALEESIKAANATGGNKIKEVHIQGARGTSTKSASLGISWLKKILDAPSGVVPTEFVLFLRVYLGQAKLDDVLKLAKRNKVSLDWISEVDFSTKKKEATEKGKAAKAASNKKADPLVDEDDEEFEVED